MIMAASAAMIVAGFGLPAVHAQNVGEASSAPASGGTMLVNQIQDLRAQMQQMQGQIEELQHKLQQLQDTSKDQYVDLDSRIGKLEQGPSAASTSSVPPPANAASTPAASSTASAGKPAPAGSAAPMSDADKAAAQKAYDAAFKSLRDGNYVDSARGFRAFIDKYPQSPLVANAYYWLGGSYYVTQNYKPAQAAFETMLKEYPDSTRAPEAQLRLADCQIALKNYAGGRATLEAVIKANPGTSLEKRARDRMQDIPASAGTH